LGVALLAGSLGFAALGLGALALPSREALRKSRERALDTLRSRAAGLARLDSSASEIFGEIESLLATLLELKFGITTGSLTRSQIRQALAEKTGDALASRIEKLLELCENQRYTPSGGDAAAARSAAEELGRVLQTLA
jgi:hypothetical protein